MVLRVEIGRFSEISRLDDFLGTAFIRASFSLVGKTDFCSDLLKIRDSGYFSCFAHFLKRDGGSPSVPGAFFSGRVLIASSMSFSVISSMCMCKLFVSVGRVFAGVGGAALCTLRKCTANASAIV
uniref:Uncharacterized protein n=1 Tax=Cacopsylla melanoneura TaxID=428564 RepID=A0A8D8UC56_9HEMI